jgi:TPR repeat protein
MCESGQGTGQDHQEALKWWRLAADQGHDGAKAALAKAGG